MVGGGLGGLALAQGLLRAGADVTVYERDASLVTRRQGYRLHLDARAGLALDATLPPESFALFQATCAQPSRRLTVTTERLRVRREQVAADRGADPYAPATLSTSVDRQTFREVLAAGLDGRIAFGHELARYEAGADGVRLYFADGQEAEADVLVGADGVGSVVRRLYLPAASPADSGARCIYGKTPLSPDTALPPVAKDGFTAVVGGRIGMAIGVVRFRTPPQALGLTPAQDYLMWALAGDRQCFGVPDTELTALDPAGLHALSGELIRTWHPDLRALHAAADRRPDVRDPGPHLARRARLAAEPGHGARRRHPRDEPGPRFGREHRPARRRAALPPADHGRHADHGRLRCGGRHRRLRTADARVRVRRGRRVPPGRRRRPAPAATGCCSGCTAGWPAVPRRPGAGVGERRMLYD